VTDRIRLTRRQWLAAVGGGVVGAALPRVEAGAAPAGILRRAIPATGEAMPVIGMGTWRTFNVGNDPVLRDDRVRVLEAFFANGGRMVDCSPMYGSSPAVVGYGLERLGRFDQVFSAEKVWTSDEHTTRRQIEASAADWRVQRFDLMQVHNLLAWRAHLPVLQEMKAAGQLRYAGITTSHGRRHGDLERVMKTQELDFVQLTYNLVDREVEERLLPLAADRGIAVIVNRPFRGGPLVDRFQGRHRLPGWAAELGCRNWPQLLLKFVVSHPAVTCAIPATTRVEHMRENMGAAHEPMPDAATRRRLLAYTAAL